MLQLEMISITGMIQTKNIVIVYRTVWLGLMSKGDLEISNFF